MKKLIKNRQGDVPVMILVLLVIAICGMAILSFIIFNKSGAGNELGVEVIEEMNSDIEKFYFYLNVLDDNKAAEMIEDIVITNGKMLITKSNEVVSVKYSFSP